ncbi:hypothetical protein A9Q99_10515 [Gammaproteobacteria bacterium 45_16_T64]|nr:hypothetical protein A9Q99_10515 [Gammaproteobacteria bacterium 45_16_T64]
MGRIASGYTLLRATLFIIFGLTITVSHASTVFTIDQHTRSQALTPYVHVLEDPTNQLTIENIASTRHSQSFTPPQKKLQFSYSSSTFWLRFTLHNTLPMTDHFLVQFAYPLIDTLQLFTPSDSGFQISSLGDSLRYSEREFQLRTFVFRVPLQANETKTFYVKVQSSSTISLPIMLYTQPAFYEHLHDSQTYIGFFYGICFGLLAYNLFLFIATREKMYFYYIGVVATNMYSASCFDGFNYRLFPDWVFWQNIAIYASICMSLICGALFGRAYFHTKVEAPMSNRFISSVVILSLVEFLVLLVWPGKIISIIILATIAYFIVGIMTTAYLRLRAGFAPAKLFLLAWFVMLAPIFVGLLNAVNVLSLHEWTPYLHKIGVAGEMIILSLALANRINTLKSAEQKAKTTANQAVAEANAKSEFLAKMSHEIRTPMNGVLGMSELLKETPLQTNQMHYVRTIYNSGQALLGIINDILDYSKIEAGKLDLESVDFNLEELMDECVSVFSLRSTDQNIPILSLMDIDVPRFLCGDPTRLRQVIINLLGNAFKFTEEGEIRLNAALVSQDKQRIIVRFEIIDSGVGITVEQQSKLFQSFSQADASTTRKYGGTGLGLAICKELAELMDGDIGVISEAGTGSTFWFTASLDVSTQLVSDAEKKVLKEVQGHHMLVVDDHEHFCHVVGTLGTSWGMTVDIVHNGKSAIDKITALQNAGSTIDVALIDQNLPDTKGLELSKEIEKLTQDQPFPHLLVTSARNLPKRAELEGTGITIALEKPIPSSHLRKTLARALTGNATDQRRWFENDDTDSDKYQDLHVLVADDNSVNMLVIVGMLKRMGITPITANNGFEAVERFRDTDQAFDLVLMDCEMPVLDGYDATRQIRQIEMDKGQHCMIFALSAHAMAEHYEKSKNAGMDEHIAKPVSIDALKIALQTVVDHLARK